MSSNGRERRHAKARHCLDLHLDGIAAHPASAELRPTCATPAAPRERCGDGSRRRSSAACAGTRCDLAGVRAFDRVRRSSVSQRVRSLRLHGGELERTHPDGPRALTVNGGPFEARYAEPSGDRPDLAESKSIVESVVAGFNASGNPGRFEVRELPAGNLVVVGVSVADEQGSQTDIEPILDTTITLHGSSMRADLAFEELSRELQAKAGRTVGVATTGNLFRQSQPELPDGKMSARTALIQLISQLRIEFHWRAFYAPHANVFRQSGPDIAQSRSDPQGRGAQSLGREAVPLLERKRIASRKRLSGRRTACWRSHRTRKCNHEKRI